MTLDVKYSCPITKFLLLHNYIFHYLFLPNNLFFIYCEYLGQLVHISTILMSCLILVHSVAKKTRRMSNHRHVTTMI